jgi:predicted site-specific integrase-resolvase
MTGVASFYCDHCKRSTHFVPVYRAAEITGVSRRSIYSWIDKGLVHWTRLPSGRRMICTESLQTKVSSAAA